MHNKYTMLSAKVKFIQDIVNGKLKVMNRKNKDLEEDLKQKGYPMLSEKVDVDEEKEENREEMKDEGKIEVLNYNYLTRMPIQQLTYEKKLALEKEAEKLNMMINDLKKKQIHSIWEEELNEVEKAWNIHLKDIKELYETDLEEISKKKVLKKKK